MSTEKTYPTDKEAILLERIRNLENENRGLQGIFEAVISCFQKTEPAWDTVSEIYASGNVPEVLVQADPKALEALQELLWGTFEFGIKYVHGFSESPKAQRLAALVREALKLVQKAHEEGTKEPEGELDTWEKSSAFQAVAKIEKDLEALEKEP